jgi:putative endonuclease
MSKHINLGALGEKIGRDYLLGKGYTILEQNWRYSRAEIDIIAKEGEVLVFVEVKTRSTALFGEPALAVTPKKQALLVDAASAYMERIQHEWEIRFDIISIVMTDKDHDLEHYKDAFFPGW